MQLPQLVYLCDSVCCECCPLYIAGSPQVWWCGVLSNGSDPDGVDLRLACRVSSQLKRVD